MSGNFLTKTQAYTKLGKTYLGNDNSHFITKQQLLDTGANAHLMQGYTSEQFVVDNDIEGGSLIVSLIGFEGNRTYWHMDDLTVSIQGEVKLSSGDQLEIRGNSGSINFYTDLSYPLETDGGGWFIEYDFRNMGNNFEKTIFCFNDYDNLNPISGVAKSYDNNHSIDFYLLGLTSNKYENLGYQFGDGDLLIPWEEASNNYVLLMFLNEGGNYRLGITTTNPALEREQRIQQALMAVKDDRKEPFVSAYPHRWMQVPEYEHFLAQYISAIDDISIKKPNYDLPDPDLGEPFNYGYDSIDVIIKSIGILKFK